MDMTLITKIQQEQFGCATREQVEKFATYMPHQCFMIRFKVNEAHPQARSLDSFRMTVSAMEVGVVVAAICASGAYELVDVILTDKVFTYARYDFPKLGEFKKVKYA